MTSDTRRFWLCLGVSTILNLLALALVGQFSPELRLPPIVPQPHLTLVTLRPAPRPKVPVKPPKRKIALRRPGAKVKSSHPAPLARQATRHPGGSHARSPLPKLAAKPATPAPMPVFLNVHIRHPILAAHRLPTPSAVALMITPPTLTPPALTASGAHADTGTGSKAGTGKDAGDGNGSGSGNGNGTGPAPGEPFGVGAGLAGEGAPRHIVYVLDISGSMTSRIDRATEELKKALSGLRPNESFNIVAFSDRIQSFDSGMAPASPALIRRADGFLESLEIGGGTDLESALDRTLSLPTVNEVVVLTDGVPTIGDTDFRRIARHVREINVNHARISTVGLVGKNPDGTDDSFDASTLLQKIAADSGGDSKLVPLGVATP